MRKLMLPLCGLVILAGVVAYILYPTTYKYETSFYDVFDTYSTLTIYSSNEELATGAMDEVHARLQELNRLYDIYNDYEDINNLKTINDNAGLAPVKVEEDIIELLIFARECYGDTEGAVNPMMGSVLTLWHDYRTEGIENPDTAALPPMEELTEASGHTDISLLVIDEADSTVFITDEGASLDVGAIAKGWAADEAAKLLKEMGIDSALINLGGNVVAIGTRGDGKAWVTGVVDPWNTGESCGTIEVMDKSVVTSGSYQRYYTVDGKTYNHIIDPETLMPGERYASVTVACESSAVADMLSTALFILPEEEGDRLAEQYGADICRIYKDGRLVADEAFKPD